MLPLQKFQLDHLKKTLEYFVLEGGSVFCRNQIRQARKAPSVLSGGEAANVVKVSF